MKTRAWPRVLTRTVPLALTRHPNVGGWSGRVRPVLWLLAFTVGLAHGMQAHAANVYVGPSASGDGSGSDWNNQAALGSVSLARGSTYFVADGSYGSKTWDTAPSGVSPITIRKATAANHGSNTGWNNALGDGQAVWTTWRICTPYWVFDGASGGGPGSWDAKLGFRLQSGAPHVVELGFNCSGSPSAADHVTIQHVDIEGGGAGSTAETDLVYNVAANDYFSLRYSYLHDVSRTMILTWPSDAQGWLVEYNKFARNGPAEHREAWSAGTDDNVTIRYNLWEDICGTSVIAIVNGKGMASNWDIYGNVFYSKSNVQGCGINSGLILNRYDGGACSDVCVSAENWHVYNNVIANQSAVFAQGSKIIIQDGSSYVVENNLWYANEGAGGVEGATTADYNWFYGNARGDQTSGPHDLIGTASPFAGPDPWHSGNWELAGAIAGHVLGAPYNQDMFGATRGADGTFDRGALELSQGGGLGTAPNPPTNLRLGPAIFSPTFARASATGPTRAATATRFKTTGPGRTTSSIATTSMTTTPASWPPMDRPVSS